MRYELLLAADADLALLTLAHPPVTLFLWLFSRRGARVGALVAAFTCTRDSTQTLF